MDGIAQELPPRAAFFRDYKVPFEVIFFANTCRALHHAGVTLRGLRHIWSTCGVTAEKNNETFTRFWLTLSFSLLSIDFR